MAYINQPDDLRRMFQDIDARLRLIETATRFFIKDEQIVRLRKHAHPKSLFEN